MNNNISNEILNRSDIVEVISKYVPLSKRGKNYFGLCPFHDDHNESMSVSPEKQIFKCFACGESGNVFSFIAKYNNISFGEAIKLLGEDLGISVSGALKKEVTKYKDDYDIYELSTKIYQNNLNTSSGKGAMEYLEKRGITNDAIKKFRIGVSLSKSILVPYLKEKKYSVSKLIDLGIANEYERDKFQNRIMFPLFDLKGNAVAFSGRIYNTDSESKYINTMETEIFKKGELLYNYHNARDNLKKTDYVIVMEGFMDVIRASIVGIDSCVATMGTALTKEHVNLLKKITDNIILCFDGDKAGEKATISALKLMEELNITPKIIRLKENLDPDEYIIKYGKEAFELEISNAITPLDFKLRLYKNDKKLNNEEDLSKYLNEALMELTKEKDEILVDLTIKKLSSLYNSNYDILKNTYNKFLASKNKKEKDLQNNISVIKYTSKERKLTQYRKAEYYLMYYMLLSDMVIDKVNNKVIYFMDEDIKYLSNEIINYRDKYGIINISSFISYVNDKEELRNLLNDIISFVDKDEFVEEEIDDYIKVINNNLKKDRIKSLEQELKNEYDPLKKADILSKIMEIKGVKL